MLQQMKNKVSMGRDDKQRKREEKEQQRIAAAKTAELEQCEDHDVKKSCEPQASSSKDDSDKKSTDGPNRLKQNRVTRWINYALKGGITF